MTIEDKLSLLLKEYEVTVQQFRGVWGGFVQTCIILISGLLVAFFLAFQHFDKIRCAFVVLPFFLAAWYMYVELQGRELIARAGYLKRLEGEIREISSMGAPRWETTFRDILWSGWTYVVMTVIMTIPLLLVYVVSAYQGVAYAAIRGVPLAALLGVSYVVVGAGAIVVVSSNFLTVRQAIRELPPLSRIDSDKKGGAATENKGEGDEPNETP